MKILTTILALVAAAASPAAELPSSITEAVEAKIARRCGEPVKGHDNFVAHVAFSKDGKMALSASWDGSIKLWETRKGKEKKVLVGHDEPLYWAGFFEDGKRVVSTSMDQTLRIWNAKSGKELSRVDAPEKLQIASLSPDGAFGGMAFSPDGQVLATGMLDSTVLLWRMKELEAAK